MMEQVIATSAELTKERRAHKVHTTRGTPEPDCHLCDAEARLLK